jgi:flagellar basal-body rod protein FlgF/flagellar basal-body rod protein FlgG
VLLGPDAGDSQLGQAVNRYGLLGGDRLNLTQGPLQRTGNPLDLAIEGEGFFAVRTATGIRYTRDGSFHRSQSGLLVSAANEVVLSSSMQPISVPTGDVAVGADGALSVAGGVVATVGVFQFPPAVQLKPEGTNRYAAPADVTAKSSNSAIVHQGAVEGANQDLVQGTLDLMVMQRQAETMQKALTLFHSEFNKIATEDLRRSSVAILLISE